MLSFANLNEAWGEVKKKQKQTIERKKEPTDENRCDPRFGSVCDPIVVRITDPGIIKELSIYNDEYKQDVIMSILKKGFQKEVYVPEETRRSPVVYETEKKSPFSGIFDLLLDDEYKEIISVVVISAILLFLIEGMKKYNKSFN